MDPPTAVVSEDVFSFGKQLGCGLQKKKMGQRSRS